MNQPRLPGAAVAPVWDPDEKTFQREIIGVAHQLGYVVATFYPLRTQHGWRTPAGADGSGWPDVCLVGRGRILFRELKTNKAQWGGKRNVDQKAWIDRLNANTGHVNAGMWRPRDLRDQIIPELGGRPV
jgi:hypothetical protein